MARHCFIFEGGDILTTLGATWFVSYCYFQEIDKSHNNWKKVSTWKNREATFSTSKRFHKFWLQRVLEMLPTNLGKNTIGLDSITIKNMANELLKTTNWNS